MSTADGNDKVTTGDLLYMTDEQRKALPPEMHLPAFDGLGKPHSWICAVCWGDGWQSTWPCAVASQTDSARIIAEHLDLEFSW